MKKVILGLVVLTMLSGITFIDNNPVINMINTITVNADTSFAQDGIKYSVNADQTEITVTGHTVDDIINLNIPSEIYGIPVKHIAESAFHSCKTIETVTIPDSIVSIGKNAFYGTALVLNQTEDLKYAGNWLVDCKYNLESAIIEQGTVGIADSMFSINYQLKSVEIPDSVKYIGSEVFLYCNKLEDLTLPTSLVTIGERSFEECSNLKEINLPDSVISIGSKAFYNCKSATNLKLSNSLTTIPKRSFYGCRGLTEITIPDSVTVIENSAFECCSNVTKLTLSNSLTDIGQYAFLSLESLNIVTIPKSVTNIGTYALGYGSGKIFGFTIYGVEGSVSEEYAINNEFKFIATETKPTTGDIDGDGETTSNDALNVLKIVVGSKDLTDEQKQIADLDGDGNITSSDALVILQIVVGLK